MKVTTAEQLVAIGRLLVDKKVPIEQTQKILDSGLLSDLCDGNLDQVTRNDFRRLLGLVPPTKPVNKVKPINITRRVKVNRSLTPQQALDATGRKQYTDRQVVDAMPRGEGDEAEVVFFKPEPWEYTRPGFMSDDCLELCLDRRNLRQAPPDDVAAVNVADATFADTHPHGTHWKDANGNWCFAAFGPWDGGERRVVVRRYDVVWVDGWWFAGLRKSSGLGT